MNTARLPARVTVSSASTTMAQCYTPGLAGACPAHHTTHHRKVSRLKVVTSPSSSMTPTSATPAMRQYLDVKRQHRDAIVFFRMGDFYEMFYEDALTSARVLELTLTSRAKD